MLSKPKTRRILILALLGIALFLSIATGRLYLMVQAGYGTSAAFLTLMIITIVILGLMCKGVQYAVAIEKAVRNEITTPIPERKQNIETPHVETIVENQSKIFESGFQAHKRRGKHSRFPINQITKAVLNWERRDPQFTALTLTEFLEQEFGAGPDGVLLMAPTTFYDWRRRILSNLEEQNKNRLTDPDASAH